MSGPIARRSQPSSTTPRSSAHLFLSDVIFGAGAGSEAPFLTGGLLFSTANMEGALFRVLSHANQSTFSNVPLAGTESLGFTLDYTPMFEMPYGRAVVSGGVGAWEGRKTIQDHQALFYGGAPGVAAAAYGRYSNSRGTNWSPPPNVNLDTFSGTQQFYDIQGRQMGTHRQGHPHRILEIHGSEGHPPGGLSGTA